VQTIKTEGKTHNMPIDLSGRVAIVTGAGGGLGRSHALALARRGAKVVVNDLGSARDGKGGSTDIANIVADEIERAGGEAIANGASVTEMREVEAMVADAVARWGRVDILVNNAGILRDRTFAKMELDDFRAVLDVHLMGSVNCTKAVWNLMRDQAYGRIIMTTSSSGLYGNFGQAHYGAAKMALVGLMNTLRLEGARYNVRVNCLSPSAATRMTEEILGAQALAQLATEAVSPAVVALAADDAPSGIVLCAGAGHYGRAYVTLTGGLFVTSGEESADRVLAGIGAISDRAGEIVPAEGIEQSRHEVAMASLRVAA
jgi:NAD(P)-dependent dehydrogenase (short-subunit alcohol dehydrogenase family)